MNKVKKIILVLAALLFFVLTGNAYSADESTLFTSVPPDALVVLDLSGSMDWNPAGGTYVWGVSSCAPNTTVCNCGGTGANNGYCNTSTGGCNINCSRVNMAKRAFFNMLDDTDDNTIRSTGTNTDDSSLNIRIGYMNFCNGNDTAGNYSAGNIMLRRAIGTSYGNIFCGADTCTMASITDSGICTNRVDNTQASSGTPLSSALIEAKNYLDWHKSQDNARECRDKYVILISDGADTYTCSGTGSEDVSDMYKRRRETVARAKALGDAGYKVFVIGFGADMPLALRNTLNWAAYYGGTDDPTEPNSGNLTGYDIQQCDPKPCSAPIFPSGVTSCQVSTINNPPTNPSTPANDPYYNIAGKGGYVGDRVATSNDPATVNLSGYAFIAGDATQLNAALKQAVSIIRSARYSFTHASVATGRIADDNYLYEASFTPIDDEPFWLGRLKKYNIQADGNIGSQVWDAGTVLAGTAASARNIKTCLSGTAMTNFATSLTPTNLGVSTTTRRDEIVGYIRGEDAYNQDFWKLGDIWHSSPVIIGSPSPYFEDRIDRNRTFTFSNLSGLNAFEKFRLENERTSANNKQVIVAGANDGQFHVFKTSDGQETFSFIPPNMLPKLQLIAHTTHPTLLTHQFFVDGPISMTDVWLGSGNGTSKSPSDWKTMVAFGLGRGANDYSGSEQLRPYLWSASPTCTPTSSTSPYGYNYTYHATNFPYYCGYYAFDFTDTLSPEYMWLLNPSASDAPYLGEPWSKMAMGRVKIGGNEKWVGFLGGGGYQYSCSNPLPNPANIGKGFFVVDLSNGSILWRYTAAHNSSMRSIPAQPIIIDTDLDGFIDTAYVGDLGGNMWRFTFCERDDKNVGDPCTNTSNWKGGLLYNAGGTGRPIYTKATAALDESRDIWVYWGTGDKQCPAAIGVSENFFALKDADRTTTHSSITSSNGWSISLSSNEKVLSDNTVFDCALYFTTFAPLSSTNPCQLGGAGYLYGVHYTKGIGVLNRGNISACDVTTAATSRIGLGTGIPSAPIVSLKPVGKGADLYITTSGGGGIDSRTFKETRENPGGTPPGGGKIFDIKSDFIYWKDKRLQ